MFSPLHLSRWHFFISVTLSGSFCNLSLSLRYLSVLSLPVSEHGRDLASVSPAVCWANHYNDTSARSLRSLLNAAVWRAMLSGTWRRSVGPQHSAAVPDVTTRGLTVCGVPSGTVVLEAQYDYNYRGADGRQVCIREGERFILLKKTNTDWWQVGRLIIFCFYLCHWNHLQYVFRLCMNT